MGFSIETSVSAVTVFLQGALSFFSPCVLPLVPLYVSYLAGGAAVVGEDGVRRYPRGKIFLNTLFFVAGISFAFFLLGLGLTALGAFFHDYQVWFARISGVIILLFGLYQLGLGKRAMLLEQERRLPFRLDKLAMNPAVALVMGFTFSFAWTPCVGPTLSSVLLMASSAESSAAGFLLIGVYTLGFVLPFLAVGLFTGAVLDFFKAHQSVVRYTVKIGAVLLIVMGILTLTGATNGLSADLAAGTTTQEEPAAPQDGTASGGAQEDASGAQEESGEIPVIPAPDFTLTDQYGETHTLSDYQGKTVFLNFWATWCGPCKMEMPDIQALYEDWDENAGDLVVLGVAGPGIGQEGSAEDIAAFLEENGYTYPVVMDDTGTLFYQYGISAYPTTFMIDPEGNVFGYVQGAVSREIMDDIVEQTMTGQRR
ncbi:redoxin domain-containing protein [Oscillibacter valericigenes]|uniref:Redoxin domain-containing protein n=1 Tax=Oscillibacter valericigenes TaxID=351091 RepID=A0ABS2FTV1_9FIRM|nr:cytochrome c biogenesis protein CcdA [Oscillibacter valericigenes]MBM6850302.1 redoxin domain-containing protein [Oscillibacter valericigenes]